MLKKLISNDLFCPFFFVSVIFLMGVLVYINGFFNFNIFHMVLGCFIMLPLFILLIGVVFKKKEVDSEVE